jgi:2-polyprenyl-3-methyl-5-hydroxy-6-metoxy-1,4-benzoquinol methylase
VCPCGGEAYDIVFRYDRPPEGETRFPSAASDYRRDVLRCRVCGHFVSRHEMDLTGLYAGEYVDATYGDHMRRNFERIVSMPPELSDNEGRTRAVSDFAGRHYGGGQRVLRLLDVGSGLGVFPYRMAQEGWDCTALDPDARAVRHASEVAGVRSLQADFMLDEIAVRYDVVTLNKVLEHVRDPVAMLARARPILSPGGFVYVELPDGEEALHGGPGREEFFIEHHHIFSMVSMALMMTRAGFRLIRAERLREPSGKYTLRGFAGHAK